MNFYQQKIKETMEALGRKGEADPRHVEAWMRVGHECLDSLSPTQFAQEVKSALTCIACAPEFTSENLAASYGL